MLSISIGNVSAGWKDFPKTANSDIDVLSENADIGEELVRSELELGGKFVQAFLSCNVFCWRSLSRPGSPWVKGSATQSVNVTEIFEVQYEQEKAKFDMNEVEMFPGRCFRVQFAKRVRAHCWKTSKLLFLCRDSQICQVWVEALQKLIQEAQRPRSLLVFVNPVGGKKQARRIFRDKVAPLFDAAKIVQNIIVTERSNHARDFLMSEPLISYDGIISVGGDGMFSEILNGVLRRVENDQKSDSVPGKKLILGIIPAGSTDTVVHCTSGSNDPVSAAIHIILGHRLPLDICSVWHQEQLLKYSVSLMGYGYFGDLIRESEGLRWMGPRRYDYAGFKKFMTNRSYKGEVTFLRSAKNDVDPRKKYKCRSGCMRCSAVDEPGSHADDVWETVTGQFISVIGANITCRCAKSSTGIAPNVHIGDGCMDLILIRKTSRPRFLHHLIKVADRTSDHFNFNFIDVYRVKEFKFRPILGQNSHVQGSTDATLASPHRDACDQVSAGVPVAQTESSAGNAMPPLAPSSRVREVSCWNIDGELVEQGELHIKVHRQLVTLFASGIEDGDQPALVQSPRKIVDDQDVTR